MSLLSGARLPSPANNPVTVGILLAAAVLGVVLLCSFCLIQWGRDAALRDLKEVVEGTKAEVAGAKAEARAAAENADKRGQAALSQQRAEFLTLKKMILVNTRGGHITPPKTAKQGIAVSFANNPSFTDAQLGILEELPEITELDLRGTKVTDQGVKLLAALKDLTVLSLQATDITSKAVEHLSGMENLQELDLSKNNKIDSMVLWSLPKLPNLTTLALSHTKLKEFRVSSKHLPAVKRLDLGNTDVDDNAIPDLCKFKTLTVLELNNSKIQKPESFAALTHECPNLTRLELGGCQLVAYPNSAIPTTIPPALKLAADSRLEGLNLNNTKFRKQWLADLKQLKLLRVLDLSGNPDITPAEVRLLEKDLPKLIKLEP